MEIKQNTKYKEEIIKKLNKDIEENFDNIFPIEKSYKNSFSSISRMVMLDRYSQKDKNLKTLKLGDLVIVILKHDPIFPSRGIGYIQEKINNNEYIINIDEEYWQFIDEELQINKNRKSLIKVQKNYIEKPLEIFFEQIAKRVAYTLGVDEKEKYKNMFFEEIKNLNIIPAGRVLYGVGSENKVTLFNCFVMPMMKDSREGISIHRKEVMEIMSHGGGVGTNGSTLRPKGAIAKGVGGKSSGAVSWLNDLASLTHLVEQGGSRRGAQMIMLSDWHPDIIEFIVSKMLNPRILKWLKDNVKDELIQTHANNKIKLEPIKSYEIELYDFLKTSNFKNNELLQKLETKIKNNGEWKVNNETFLTGANISVNISNKFMKAIENDSIWELRFPDIDNYSSKEKEDYNNKWHEIGDVDEWEKMGYKIKTYYKMRARDLWDLINFCANYSAEPGIFFIDRANELTNAKSYGMKVVATNPCGEQPLAPYSVCNLAAINLANFVNKKTGEILWEKLKSTIKTCVRLQDNVIDKTHYFLENNKKQALGERRVGLGVMGLHDLLIWNNVRYGSKKSIKIIDKIFKIISETAYETSANLAKEKGSFPFLKDSKEFINTGYMKKMSKKIKDLILKNGIRNSHLLTIAPTGSTGTMLGVSTGLEPYFAFEFYRSGRLGKNIKIKADIVNEWLQYNKEYKNKELPDIFVTAMQLSPEEHVAVQCTIQNWVDSSISKTVNAPKGYSVKQVQKVYENLYKNGAKGGTVYVDGSRDSQVLSLDNEKSFNEQLELDGLENINGENDNSLSKKIKTIATLRGIKQDRKYGIKIGDLCPLCKEGTMVDSGGCSTCNNCNSQLKCDI